MSDRAIAQVTAIFENPGVVAGVNIVARDSAFRRYIALSGIRPQYQDRAFEEILDLAGFAPDEYEQHKLDVGVGEQFPFLLGGGGPRAATGLAPRAVQINPNPRSVWSLGQVTRGRIIEAALGHNLPSAFPVIDRFERGVATSIKSVNLNALRYQRLSTLSRLLRGEIDRVAGFRGRVFARGSIREHEIKERALDLVIPHHGAPAQQDVIQDAIRYGQSHGVVVNVLIHP